MAGKLQPLADRVVVKPIQREEVTKAGIVLPDEDRHQEEAGRQRKRAHHEG